MAFWFSVYNIIIIIAPPGRCYILASALTSPLWLVYESKNLFHEEYQMITAHMTKA